MKKRWLIVWAAGFVTAAIWVAAVVAKVFFDPSLAVWTAIVTAGALSLEAFFWVAAGVFGWSFLAGRRETIARIRRRFFGG